MGTQKQPRQSDPGALVPLSLESPAPDVDFTGLWPDPDSTHSRRSECVEYAVLRRLVALGPSARQVWRERFSPLADAALVAAGTDRALLAGIERENPATEAAGCGWQSWD